MSNSKAMVSANRASKMSSFDANQRRRTLIVCLPGLRGCAILAKEGTVPIDRPSRITLQAPARDEEGRGFTK
jgi:hypothetical protein